MEIDIPEVFGSLTNLKSIGAMNKFLKITLVFGIASHLFTACLSNKMRKT